MPHRMVMSLEPIVMHGVREFAEGASLAHVLREATTMGAMMGAGVPVHEAVTAFELKEPKLIGLGPGEAWEGGVHGTARGGATGCGCGQRTGTMMMPGLTGYGIMPGAMMHSGKMQASMMPVGMMPAGMAPVGMARCGAAYGGAMAQRMPGGAMAQRSPGMTMANVAVPTVVLVF